MDLHKEWKDKLQIIFVAYLSEYIWEFELKLLQIFQDIVRKYKPEEVEGWFKAIPSGYWDKTQNTVLHVVACQDNEDFSKYMVSTRQEQINQKNAEGKTPFILAIESQSIGVVKLFLDYGAITDNKYYDAHYGPLHIAVECGQMDLVKILIVAGCDVNAFDTELENPLHSLLARSKIPDQVRYIAEYLINVGVDIDQLNSLGESPLHFAIQYHHSKVADLLLDRGANTTIVDRYSQTLLHLAIQEKESEVAKRLVRSTTICLDAIDTSGMSHLAYAIKVLDYDVTRMLVDRGVSIDSTFHHPEFDPFFEAVRGENMQLLQLLLELKPMNIDLNKTRLLPATLQIALNFKRLDMVKLLLEHGVDTSVKICRNLGILYWVSNSYMKSNSEGNERSEVIEFMKSLLISGAGLNLERDEIIKIMSFIISYAEDLETVQFFHERLENSFEMTDANSPDLLYVAVKDRREKKVIEYVLKKQNLDINTIYANGRTILHDAVQSSNVSCVKYLIKKGADVNFQTLDGSTTLHFIAGASSCMDILQLLLYYNADVNRKDYKGSLPLQIAVGNFGLKYSYRKENVWLIMKYIILSELLMKPIERDNYRIINSESELHNFYKKGKAELIAMQRKTIIDSISFFEVMTNAMKYRRNTYLVRAIPHEDALKSEFPMFEDIFTYNLKKARKRPLLVEEAKESLGHILRYDCKALPGIFDNIFKYFSNKDLRLLISTQD